MRWEEFHDRKTKQNEIVGGSEVVGGGATPGVGEQKMGHYVGMEAACPSRLQRRLKMLLDARTGSGAKASANKTAATRLNILWLLRVQTDCQTDLSHLKLKVATW